MTASVYTQTRRRLALLFSLPLAFTVLFFSVDLATEHTDIDLLKIQNLGSSVNQLAALAYDAQSGERGFLLTGDERYLLPLDQANASLETQVYSCQRNARDQTRDLQTEVAQIVALVRKRLAQANSVMRTQRAQGFAAAVDFAKSNGSEETMNEIRQRTGQLQTKLDSAQARFLESQRGLNRWQFLVFVIGFVVLIGVMLWLFNGMLSYLDGREAAGEKLQGANRELADMTAQLEGRIEARTYDLTQANEELQQFAYVASHDLQEPLRTITSFTQLLEERYKGRLDEDADEFIGYIVSASRRMSDLINGLLALVRLRKSGQPTGRFHSKNCWKRPRLVCKPQYATIRRKLSTVHFPPW